MSENIEKDEKSKSGNDNKIITNYLNDYYIFEKLQPEFAVLLVGDWGVGKTYFIDRYISDLEKIKNKYIKEKKHSEFLLLAFESDRSTKILSLEEKIARAGCRFVRVSLFGLKSIEELNEEIFYNILNNYSAKVVYYLLRAVSFFKIPYIDSQLIVGSIKKHIDKFIFDCHKNKVIYILDDLERSDIPLKELLGWINRKVEVEKEKVILIANENKLRSNNKTIDNAEKVKNQEIYDDFKEKVIGKTFQVKPDIVGTIEFFLENAGKNVKRYVSPSYRQVIIDIYQDYNPECMNFRQLKQAIDDFEHLLDGIGGYYFADEKETEDLLKKLICNFFVLKLIICEWKLAYQDFFYEKVKGIYEELERNKEKSDFSKKYIVKFTSNNEITEILFQFHIWRDCLFYNDFSKLKSGINEYLERIKNTRFSRLLHKLESDQLQISQEGRDEILKELEKCFVSLDPISYEEYLRAIHHLGYACIKKRLEDNDFSRLEDIAFKYWDKFSTEWQKTFYNPDLYYYSCIIEGDVNKDLISSGISIEKNLNEYNDIESFIYKIIQKKSDLIEKLDLNKRKYALIQALENNDENNGKEALKAVFILLSKGMTVSFEVINIKDLCNALWGSQLISDVYKGICEGYKIDLSKLHDYPVSTPGYFKRQILFWKKFKEQIQQKLSENCNLNEESQECRGFKELLKLSDNILDWLQKKRCEFVEEKNKMRKGGFKRASGSSSPFLQESPSK